MRVLRVGVKTTDMVRCANVPRDPNSQIHILNQDKTV